MPLKPGDAAPEFELMDQDKKIVKLSNLRGKKVMLIFYPMDFSPVCTTEHCAFGAPLAKATADGQTVVFGVNCDSPFTHAAFKKQYDLQYDLLSDPTRKMVQAYDMWAGLEPYNCAKRGTVVIDANGRISKWEEVAMREPRKVEEIVEAVGMT
jgi:peroxiredoxin